jgi:hypothetical protein
MRETSRGPHCGQTSGQVIRGRYRAPEFEECKLGSLLFRRATELMRADDRLRIKAARDRSRTALPKSSFLRVIRKRGSLALTRLHNVGEDDENALSVCP